jgi:excisionase family DNA binding protein
MNLNYEQLLELGENVGKLVVDRLSRQFMAEANSRYITVEKAALYCDLSPRTIQKLMRTGKLPRYQLVPGGRVVIDRQELDAVIRSSKVDYCKAFRIRSR